MLFLYNRFCNKLGLYNKLVSTVLDSLSIWNIFNTDFDFIQSNEVVNFNNLSSNYDSVLWDFGDGNTSSDEKPEPLRVELYVSLQMSRVFGRYYNHRNCGESFYFH